MKHAEEALEDAKKAINEGGVPRLRSAAENVEKSLHKMAEELYKKSQAASGAEQAGAAGAGAASGSTGGGSAAGGQSPAT